MRIIGPASSDVDTVKRNVVALGAKSLFVDQMVPALWTAASTYFIDPVGMVAQSYKETGGGSYTGKVKPEFYNPAGIKVRHQNLFPGITDGDNPLAHAMFPSWEIGTEAHAQHLRAYAGWPVSFKVVDPRYTYVVGKYKIENWFELSGKWAPSTTYGSEIEDLMRKLSV